MNPLDAGLRQPDPRSCGAASLVMARLVRTGTSLDAAGFRTEVLAEHRRLTRARLAGRWQLPWPRALGTPPWAVARGLEELTGRPHEVRLVRWSRTTAYDRLVSEGGVLYVGSRTLPRHVLLVLRGSPDDVAQLSAYEPSRGAVVTLPREDLVAGRLRRAGWPCPWFTIAPAGPGVRATPPPPRR